LLMVPFCAALNDASPAFEISKPLYEPHHGAALYAAKLWKEMRR